MAGGRFIHLLAAIEVFIASDKENLDKPKAMSVIREYLILMNLRTSMVEIQKQEKALRVPEKTIMDIVATKGSAGPELLVYDINQDSVVIVRTVDPEYLVTQIF